jgi:hypothetical protein
LLDASSKNLVSWLAVFLFLERVRDSTEMPPHPILKQLPTSSEPYAAAKRDVIARGILTNWEDLARKLRRYINAYSSKRQADPVEIF